MARKINLSSINLFKTAKKGLIRNTLLVATAILVTCYIMLSATRSTKSFDFSRPFDVVGGMDYSGLTSLFVGGLILLVVGIMLKNNNPAWAILSVLAIMLLFGAMMLKLFGLHDIGSGLYAWAVLITITVVTGSLVTTKV